MSIFYDKKNIFCLFVSRRVVFARFDFSKKKTFLELRLKIHKYFGLIEFFTLIFKIFYECFLNEMHINSLKKIGFIFFEIFEVSKNVIHNKSKIPSSLNFFDRVEFDMVQFYQITSKYLKLLVFMFFSTNVCEKYKYHCFEIFEVSK